MDDFDIEPVTLGGDDDGPKQKGGGGGFLPQIIMAFFVGCAAFATVWFLPARGTSSAMCPDPSIAKAGETMLNDLPIEETAFIEMEPFIVTLGEEASSRNLRIGLTLETAKGQEADVVYAMPKLRDAFTGYLRAMQVTEIEDPNSMVRLRAQLQRRAQVVLGNQDVRSVLITDFVIR